MLQPRSACSFCFHLVSEDCRKDSETCYFCDNFFLDWRLWRKEVLKAVGRLRSVSILVHLHLHPHKAVSKSIENTVTGWLTRKGKQVSKDSPNVLAIDLRCLVVRNYFRKQFFRGIFVKTHPFTKADLEKRVGLLSKKFLKCEGSIRFVRAFSWSTRILSWEPLFFTFQNSSKKISLKKLRLLVRRVGLRGFFVRKIVQSDLVEFTQYMSGEIIREYSLTYTDADGKSINEIANSARKRQISEFFDIIGMEVVHSKWQEDRTEKDAAQEV